MTFARWIVAAAAVSILISTNGCDQAADSTTQAAGAKPDGEGDGRQSASLSPEEAANRAPARVDPTYVESAQSRIAELEITAEAMKAAAVNHPGDELLAKFVDRADKKIPTVRKKVEHLQEVARDENIAILQKEIDDLLANISEAVEKGAKRAAKLDQMPQRPPREPRERRNADEVEGDVVDDESDSGDGGEADDGSGD
jgi:hypothetical protein